MNISDALVGAVKLIRSVSLPETDVAQQRLQICSSCEHRAGMRCGICKCVLAAKVKYDAEHCPVGRW
mgnify:CR=1 FL=1